MKASELILWLIIGIAVNRVIAIFVLSSIDDEKHRLLAWFKACPYLTVEAITMQLWPIVAFCWMRRRDR